MTPEFERPSWAQRPFQFEQPLWMLAESVERLRGLVPRLAACVAVEGPIVHDWMPARSADFADPDGHELELCAPLNDQRHAP